ncbi:MATE family efflux transporter [Alteromonas sp. HB246098]
MALSTKAAILNNPLLSTFFKQSFLSLIGLTALTTASLVDGIFVGQYVGPLGLAAVALLLPYITFLVALSLMLAIGGSVTIGTFMGKGDTRSGSALFTQILIVTVTLNVILAVLSYVAEPALFWLLHVPSDIAPLTKQYFSVLRWVFILQFSGMVLYYLVRADGYTKLATAALLIGAVSNIALDALFVGHLGFGMEGAAYATGLAQALQLIILLAFFADKSRAITLSTFNKPWRRLFYVLKNGISEFTNEISVGVLFLVINALLVIRSGSEGVAAYSVVNYFIFLSIMISFGIADALHLLVSYNRGASQPTRVNAFLLIALATVFAVGLILTACLLWFKPFFVGLFLAPTQHEVSNYAYIIILYIWPLFLVNGCNVLLSVFLTAIERPFHSAVIALGRSILFPVCFLLFLFHFTTSTSLDKSTDFSFLIALPIAEWVTLGCAVFFVCKHYYLKRNT